MNRWINFLRLRCPACGKGALFSPFFKVRSLYHMKTHCAHCQQKYELENGFYYGAMYISYGLSVAWVVAWSLIIYTTIHPKTPWLYMIVPPLAVILLSPLNYRYSRAIWLYLFYKNFSAYQGKK